VAPARCREGLLILGLLCVPGLVAGSPAFAQGQGDVAELKSELEALKQGQLLLHRELQEIKGLLLRPPPPAETRPLSLHIDGYPSKGHQNATLVLIEFTDYQCPFCANYFRETWPEIEHHYVNSGQLRYVVRDFPLEAIHKDAINAAEAAHCAGEQGQYWPMHERLFRNQSTLSRDDLLAHASFVGLDVKSFQACLDRNQYAVKVRQNLLEAQKMGIRGTPSFFLGIAEPDGATVKVVKMIEGAQPYAVFKEALDNLLSAENRARAGSRDQ
jgi:protein-disulfide isomerase